MLGLASIIMVVSAILLLILNPQNINIYIKYVLKFICVFGVFIFFLDYLDIIFI